MQLKESSGDRRIFWHDIPDYFLPRALNTTAPAYKLVLGCKWQDWFIVWIHYSAWQMIEFTDAFSASMAGLKRKHPCYWFKLWNCFERLFATQMTQAGPSVRNIEEDTGMEPSCIPHRLQHLRKLNLKKKPSNLEEVAFTAPDQAFRDLQPPETNFAEARKPTEWGNERCCLDILICFLLFAGSRCGS
ncbi:hypothetical protein KP509_09G033300 [Ceratopteris richardii]|uniref:Uncharacterized protein n=1 Tax=Ceratopteris richardii TaxID=49495 RepID=A0A8T2U5G8_CERRI|nr:hypothetical protein KP509_09G033300 [Ceratopteris richardii]